MDHRILRGTPAHRRGVGRMAIRRTAVERLLVERALPGLAALLGLLALALLLLVLALRARARARQPWVVRGRERT